MTMTTTEVQTEQLTRFAGSGANEELERARHQAQAVLEKAEVAGRKMFQRVQRVRSLLSQSVVLRHSAQQGRILAGSVDPAAQARGIVEHFGTPNCEPHLWQIPLHFGGALLTMKPHLLKACEQLDAEAEALESELKTELADGQILIDELAGEMRKTDQARAASIDDVLARLEAK